MDPIPFSGSPLDREGVRRRDRAWLDARLADPTSRFLPVWQAKPLLKREPRALAWAKREFFEDLETPEPVFLGSGDGVAHFAIDVSAAEKPEVAFGIADVASFDDLRAAVALLPAADAAIAAHARTLVDWHARHRHCAACGGHTRSVLGGANRVCFDCQAEHFPRTDPVAIAVVVRGDQCLLGRGPGWPANVVLGARGLRRGRREPRGRGAPRGARGGRRARRARQLPRVAAVAVPELADARLRGAGGERGRSRSIPRSSRRRAGSRAMRCALRSRVSASDLGVPPPFAIAHHLIRAWVETDVGGADCDRWPRT